MAQVNTKGQRPPEEPSATSTTSTTAGTPDLGRHAGVMRIHLDTDLGGDPDDTCALAMLLGWPGVELVGITTTIDPGGRRAGCVGHPDTALVRRCRCRTGRVPQPVRQAGRTRTHSRPPQVMSPPALWGLL